MLRILYFSYCPPIIIELPPSGAQAPRWESLDSRGGKCMPVPQMI